MTMKTIINLAFTLAFMAGTVALMLAYFDVLAK
jgi:hypothetical protein